MTGYPLTCACYAERGSGLSTEDKQLLLESVARLNAAVPIKIGSSKSWRNPQTNNSGRSSILRVFRSGGRICHLVRHRIGVAGRRARNYSLTWCRRRAENGKSKADRRGRAIAES